LGITPVRSIQRTGFLLENGTQGQAVAVISPGFIWCVPFFRKFLTKNTGFGHFSVFTVGSS
jgi:hypothetical protein